MPPRTPLPTEKGAIIAIYHLSIKIISRGKGKSADGITHDYTRKKVVIFTEILLPENAPSEYADRVILWNAVEKIEKAKNAQLAREIEVALPRELTKEENIFIVEEYVKKNFVSSGMVADVCVHDTGKGNPHAHILLTMRPFNADKTWGDKQKKEYILDAKGEKIYDPKKKQYKCKSVPTTVWNDQTKAEFWREQWAKEVNAFLSEKIDHRSYKRQGKDEIPTVHLGAAAHQMEQKGIMTDRGNINRNIKINNREIKELKKQIYQIEKWLKEQSQNAEPTLTEIINRTMQKQQFRNPEQKAFALAKVAQLINFINENEADYAILL